LFRSLLPNRHNLKSTSPKMVNQSMPAARLGAGFFARSVHAVAPELIGAMLLVDGVGGRIVEVEAYHHADPATLGWPTSERQLLEALQRADSAS